MGGSLTAAKASSSPMQPRFAPKQSPESSLPTLGLYLPDPQSVHGAEPVTLLYFPAVHLVHTVSELVLVKPFLHTQPSSEFSQVYIAILQCSQKLLHKPLSLFSQGSHSIAPWYAATFLLPHLSHAAFPLVSLA